MHNSWNWNYLNTQLTENIKMVLNSIEIKIYSNVNDKAICTLSNSGKFSIGSTWRSIKQKRYSNHIYCNLWQKNVPFAMSFLLWSDISNKLSTDNRVERLGITLNPQCQCCSLSTTRNEHEGVKQLSFQGYLSKKIWRKFLGPLGIGFRSCNLNMILLSWRNHKSNSLITNFISKTLPPFICWELWKSRYSNKFEGTKPSLYRTSTNITNCIVQVIKKQLIESKLMTIGAVFVKLVIQYNTSSSGMDQTSYFQSQIQ